MGKEEMTAHQDTVTSGIPQGDNHQQTDSPQIQEVKVNNRALLAQYVEAATLAQERLLAYLSGVLGEKGVEGQIRGWDVARGVIIVATQDQGTGLPVSTG